jgi:hypothetical protein
MLNPLLPSKTKRYHKGYFQFYDSTSGIGFLHRILKLHKKIAEASTAVSGTGAGD